jgi:hypothetical protein
MVGHLNEAMRQLKALNNTMVTRSKENSHSCALSNTLSWEPNSNLRGTAENGGVGKHVRLPECALEYVQTATAGAALN